MVHVRAILVTHFDCLPYIFIQMSEGAWENGDRALHGFTGSLGTGGQMMGGGWEMKLDALTQFRGILKM